MSALSAGGTASCSGMAASRPIHGEDRFWLASP
jgi:hypothetical protein